VIRSVAEACLVTLLALIALWAFVAYLQPGLTGELAEALLRCN
jgi:hypothetical protein